MAMKKRKPLLSRIGDAFHALSGQGPSRRSYVGAQITNTTADWQISVTSADTELRNDVIKLRARCRELRRNSDYARRYFAALENNVLGSTGIGLTMKIKDLSGDYDTEANRIIGDAFEEWCLPENCTVTGTLSWRDAQGIALTGTAEGGGCLIRRVVGFKNGFGYALQLLEIDYLDQYYNAILPNGNEVRMGVELDQWKQPVAYYLWTRHPGDYYAQTGFKRERISRDEILHLYMPERAGQTVGHPWLVSAMAGLNMLERYQEAELVAARAGAAQAGFFETETSEEFQGDGKDDLGNQTMEVEPGVFRQLPKGIKFTPYNPTHPTTAYGDYVKAVLRQIASGLGVSYVTLANDLEGVNFSSIRAGLLEEREEWKRIQNWFITHFCQPIFLEWLPYAIMSGKVRLPMSKLEKFSDHEWKPRRWPWVDPLKDVEAQILAINNRLRSPQDVLSEQGKDGETVLQEIKEWGIMEKDMGLPPLTVAPPTSKTADQPPAGEPDPPESGSKPAKKNPA